MSKPLLSRHEFDAPVGRLFATLSSEDWVRRRGAQLGDGSRVVAREERPDGSLLLSVSRELPSGVPGFLERFMPQDGRVVQVETWQPAEGDGVRRGVWELEVSGPPAEMSGQMRVKPTAAGSAYVVEGTVTVRVPLLGGRAEEFLVEMAQRLSDEEARILRTELDG